MGGEVARHQCDTRECDQGRMVNARMVNVSIRIGNVTLVLIVVCVCECPTFLWYSNGSVTPIQSMITMINLDG